jgi:hypothetical protein
MKKLIFCLLMALISCTSYAQVVREGNTFKATTTQTTKSEGQQTKYTWEDKKGNKYPIYITKSGAVYVNRKSAKTGKDYKQYLSKEIKEQIQKELNFKKS